MIGAALLHAAASHGASVEVLGDIVVVLGVCVLFGLAMQRLGQSVLVGYLLAGLLLGGPASLGIIDDVSSFSFMGEVGIALLLFTVGLDLPIDKVRKFGSVAVLAGGLQVVLTTACAALVAHGFGLGWSSSFVVGFAVSLSSTAVVIRVLDDRSQTDSVHGLVSTGVLVAQDIVVVLVLLLVPLLPGASGDHDVSFVSAAATAFGKLVGLVIVIVLVERVLMRRLFHTTGLAGARELLAVASLTVSLGAIGACWALDLSPALGGFIAGVVMADAAYASQVRSEIAPIRMGLVAVFFAYVGMVADARWMAQHPLQIGGAVLVLVVGKFLLTAVAARLARVPPHAAILTAAALAQLGEFSFAVLTTGRDVDLVSSETLRLLVAVSLVTLILTPWLVDGTSGVLQRRMLASGSDVDLDDVESAKGDATGHAIVVGVGPAGRGVVEAFAGAGVDVVVVELNPRAEAEGTDHDLPVGTRVVFGDASRPEILERAGLATARILVVTIPDPTAIRTIVAQTRQIAPSLPVVARGRYNRYVPDLAAAGADDVVDEESVTGRELADVALKRLVLSGAAERRRGDRRRAAEQAARAAASRDAPS